MAVQAQLFPEFFGFEPDVCFDSPFPPQIFDVHHHLEMQRLELDCFLQSQAEGLKSAVKEQTRQQMGLMLKTMENETISAIKQKEEDLINARNRSLELESYIKKAQRESESWQLIAKEKESMAADLSRKLEEVKESFGFNGECGDSGSICCGSNGEDEEREKRRIMCRGCNCRNCRVVFLPCRHLCCCKFCEGFFVTCPVCECFKEGSVEVFWL